MKASKHVAGRTCSMKMRNNLSSQVFNVEGRVNVCCLYCDIYFGVLLICYLHKSFSILLKMTMHHSFFPFCMIWIMVRMLNYLRSFQQ